MQNIDNEKLSEDQMGGQDASENPYSKDEAVNTEEVSEVENTTEPLQTPEEMMKEEIAQLNDKYIRLFAEFDNYKRRTAKERLELMLTANKETLVSLLPVLDDFERAMKSMEQTSDVKVLKEGVSLIQSKFVNLLHSKGLKPMESIGKEFNIDFHEAITKMPAPSDYLKDKVVDEVEKGYFLNDKVIRFAKVVVGE